MPLPYYRIDLNEVPESYRSSPQEPVEVKPDSPLKLRQEVERFAIYFRREFSYDFQQFTASEKPERPYAAYLFLNETNHHPRVWVGACCFRWREYEDAEARWGAQWAWLHPYYRGKGIFKSAWDRFHEVHGNFLSEPPFSPAMEAFLRKRDKCIYCWRRLGTVKGVVCAKCDAEHRKKTKP